MTTTSRLTAEDMTAFEPEAKIGLLATLDGQQLPHLTLITSLRAKTPTQLMWGQFCEGLSKQNIRGNPHVGFAVMNAARQLWRGKARWTHTEREGDDYELFNQLPMFRYNSYFGIHTVHYLDLVELEPRRQAPLVRMLAGTALAALAERAARSDPPKAALKPWAASHLAKLTTLKYLAYRAADGYPAIVPVVPCRPADRGRLVFAPWVYPGELEALPVGSPVAVLALNLDTESVLVRGAFLGFQRHRGVRLGIVDIDWVYNSMPPLPGPVYPSEPLRPVTTFE